jgi:hypothetical protein
VGGRLGENFLSTFKLVIGGCFLKDEIQNYVSYSDDFAFAVLWFLFCFCLVLRIKPKDLGLRGTLSTTKLYLSSQTMR